MASYDCCLLVLCSWFVPKQISAVFIVEIKFDVPSMTRLKMELLSTSNCGQIHAKTTDWEATVMHILSVLNCKLF